MMTDEEVIALYRSLLGRDPEAADTIPAFKAYYRTLDRGRHAILISPEFRGVFARVTGKVLDAGEHVAASLAMAFLARAAPPRLPAAEPPANAALADGMMRFFEAEDRAHLVVAVGEPAGLRLQDLA